MSLDPWKLQSFQISHVASCLQEPRLAQNTNQIIFSFSLPQKFFVEKRAESGDLVASLKIKFQKNRLVTHFEGEKKAVKLSVALRTTLDSSLSQGSSTTSEVFQNCAHLFIQKFAEDICPLLKVNSSLKGLQDAVQDIYIIKMRSGLKI